MGTGMTIKSSKDGEITIREATEYMEQDISLTPAHAGMRMKKAACHDIHLIK